MLATRTVYSQSSQQLFQKEFTSTRRLQRFWTIKDACQPHKVLVTHHYTVKRPDFPDRFRF